MPLKSFLKLHCTTNFLFLAVYTVEACIKLLGLGSQAYFSSNWNTFDFSITVLGILALIFEYVGINKFKVVIILRPLR